MNTASISGKRSAGIDQIAGVEFCPDPYFQNPGLWQEANVLEGSATVSDGKLICTGFKGRVICPTMLPVPPDVFIRASIVVDYTDGVGLQVIQYGGVNSFNVPEVPVAWFTGDGAGRFEYVSYNHPASSYDLNIACAFTAGNFTISKISFKLSGPPLPPSKAGRASGISRRANAQHSDAKIVGNVKRSASVG